MATHRVARLSVVVLVVLSCFADLSLGRPISDNHRKLPQSSAGSPVAATEELFASAAVVSPLPDATLQSMMAAASAAAAQLPTSGTTDPAKLSVIVPLAADSLKAAAVLPATNDSIAISQLAVAAGLAKAGSDEVSAAAVASDNSVNTAILDKHNSYRLRHQVPPLVWDRSLAAAAASVALQCKASAQDSIAVFDSTFQGQSIGGTLANRFPTSSVFGQAVVQAWYEEGASAFNYTSPQPSSGATGRFSQIVWKSTTGVGCALQTCSLGLANVSSVPTDVMVCRYQSGGNWGNSTDTSFTNFRNNVAPPLPAATLPADKMIISQSCLTSADNRFWFCMQSDGNIVLYQVNTATGSGTPIWATMTMRSGTQPYRLVMQGDGNLVAYDARNIAFWASNTMSKGRAPHRLIMQNDGNAVVYDANNVPTWATNTCCR